MRDDNPELDGLLTAMCSELRNMEPAFTEGDNGGGRGDLQGARIDATFIDNLVDRIVDRLVNHLGVQVRSA